jgi:predicted transcriptional regulator
MLDTRFLTVNNRQIDLKLMLSTTDILSIIEERKAYTVKQLAKNLEIPVEQLEKILNRLSEHDLVEYNQKTSRVTLSPWLANIDQEIGNAKPAAGSFILPKNQEIKIQDITIGNFTEKDLELNIRLKAKTKEIAITTL